MPPSLSFGLKEEPCYSKYELVLIESGYSVYFSEKVILEELSSRVKFFLELANKKGIPSLEINSTDCIKVD